LIADRAPRCTALDTLRDIAVVAMLLNHAGVSLLRPELVASHTRQGHCRPSFAHGALGYRPPAPEIIVPGEELPMNHEAA